MGSEEFYLSRVEPPNWYKAPPEFGYGCDICREPIRPGQIICESEGEYLHEDCLTSMIEDQMEDA